MTRRLWQIAALLLTALALTSALTACGGGGGSPSTPTVSSASLSGSAR